MTAESRTCRCGCGTPLRSARSEFAPGHHRRVLPLEQRARRGRFLAGRVREFPLCACGCGERVVAYGSLFRPGHNTRVRYTAEREAGTANLRVCPVCGKTVRVKPSADATWTACKALCNATLRRKAVPRNRLQRRVYEHASANGLTLKAVVEAAGLKPSTFSKWVRQKDGNATKATLEKLAAFFGIPVEQAVAEAGGTAAEARWSEIAREQIEQEFWKLGHTPEARRKRSTAYRGSTRSEAARAAISAGQKGSPNAQRAGRVLTAWHKSIRGQLVRPLWNLLRWRPDPTREQIDEYAGTVATRVGASREMVMEAWRPHLPEAGRPPKGGRPRNAARLEFYLELERTWGQKADGRAADGLFPEFKKRVKQAEGKDLSLEVLKRWTYRQIRSMRHRSPQ